MDKKCLTPANLTVKHEVVDKRTGKKVGKRETKRGGR
jgi:hypothetical protein